MGNICCDQKQRLRKYGYDEGDRVRSYTIIHRKIKAPVSFQMDDYNYSMVEGLAPNYSAMRRMSNDTTQELTNITEEAQT